MNDLKFLDDVNYTAFGYVNPRRVHEVHSKFLDIDLRVVLYERLADRIQFFSLLDQLRQVVREIGF